MKPFAFCLLIALGLSSAAAYGQDDSLPEAYLVKPGDTLDIAVWKEEDLTKTVLVRPDGRLSFPLTGDIVAAGKSIEEIRTEIRGILSRYIPDLVVTVAISEILGNKVYAIGQVNKPGVFTMNPTVDVMQLLAMAGGTTAFASVNDIVILRRVGGELRSIPFRYADVARGRDLDQNILLRSGDVVVVP
ncbi:MAG: polysaccharide biosynthesis/export family protein [Pseudomonadota bacterium]